MMRALTWRFPTAVCAAAVALLVTACSDPVPRTTPLPSFEPGTWVSEDGQYRITVNEDPQTTQFTLPLEDYGDEPQSCGRSGKFPPASTVNGTWWFSSDLDSLRLVYGNIDYGLGPAREGDWSVIVDYPCGPDYDALYLVRAEP